MDPQGTFTTARQEKGAILVSQTCPRPQQGTEPDLNLTPFRLCLKICSVQIHGSLGRQARQTSTHPLNRYENEGPETAGLAQGVTVVELRQKIVPQSEETRWADGPRPLSTYMPLATGSSSHDTQPCPG